MVILLDTGSNSVALISASVRVWPHSVHSPWELGGEINEDTCQFAVLDEKTSNQSNYYNYYTIVLLNFEWKVVTWWARTLYMCAWIYLFVYHTANKGNQIWAIRPPELGWQNDQGSSHYCTVHPYYDLRWACSQSTISIALNLCYTQVSSSLNLTTFSVN